MSGAISCLRLFCFVLIEGRSPIQCRTYYACHASKCPNVRKEVTFQFPHTSRIAATPRGMARVSYRGVDPRKEGILMLVLTLQFPSGLCGILLFTGSANGCDLPESAFTARSINVSNHAKALKIRSDFTCHIWFGADIHRLFLVYSQLLTPRG